MAYQVNLLHERTKPCLKGQGTMCCFNVDVHTFLSWLLFSYAWKNYNIIWHKGLTYEGNMLYKSIMSLSQKSRSHMQLFKLLWYKYLVVFTINWILGMFITLTEDTFQMNTSALSGFGAFVTVLWQYLFLPVLCSRLLTYNI